MKTFKCKIHKNVKPGNVLGFSDGGAKMVSKCGAFFNVTKLPDGSIVRTPKLNKKERRRLKNKS